MAQSMGADTIASPGIPKSPLLGATGRRGRIADWLFRNLTLMLALSTVALVVGIGVSLYTASRELFHHSGWSFFTGTKWDPVPAGDGKATGDLFGMMPFVYGTLVTSLLALIVAVPLGVGAAIFLAEVAPKRLAAVLSTTIELLAAVPSIVFGFAALRYLVPLFQSGAEVRLNHALGHIPLFMLPDTGLFGQDFIVAATVLAVMVLPFITAVSRDVIRAIPDSQREAGYGMGATRWEVISGLLLRYGGSGIIGSIMLALGRAVGETMAVSLVIGNSPTFPNIHDPHSFSLFRPGYTMTSVIADQYRGYNSDLHLSALIAIALCLFGITVLINALARGLIWITSLKARGESAGSTLWKERLGRTGKGAGLAAVCALLLYQIVRDIEAHGAAGVLKPAGLVAIFAGAVAALGRRLAGTRYFVAWRRLRSIVALAVCTLCAVAAASALIALMFFVVRDGAGSLNRQFFLPPNPIEPEKGGMLHAIVGSGLVLALASAIGIPIGILGGIYLSEFGRGKLATGIRFAVDMLAGAPSIVIGMFAFTMIVLPTKSYFGVAGGFALGVMMIPIIMRTTEELLALVPTSLREGSLALGANSVTTIARVVLPSARNGILTAVLVALARVAGEAAPLWITMGYSDLMQTDLRAHLPAIPTMIYYLSDQPGTVMEQRCWGLTFVLVALVLATGILARLAVGSRAGRAVRAPY
jgi:phosphate transport system permease protein